MPGRTVCYKNCNIKERIDALRTLMKERNIAAYMVPTDDFHGSEYVGEYFKCREFITGFTGSAGTAVIMHGQAGLWTDGRYFLQAEKELAGSMIDLYKSGQPGVPTIEEFLLENLKDGDILGFDGRVMTLAAVRKLEEALSCKNIKFAYREDLIDEIWAERPKMSQEKAWLLPLRFAGVSREEKITAVRNEMAKTGTDILILTSLDDIAWLLNFRGNDVACNPVVLCYAAVTKEDVVLFTDENKFAAGDKETLESSGVIFCAYNDVYEFARKVAEKHCGGEKISIMLDDYKVNYSLVKAIEHPVNSSVNLILDVNPTTLMKAVKNTVEIENMRETHIKDGAAMTKLIYWLKMQFKPSRDANTAITELDVSAKIEELRREQEGYIGPSFESIAAYGSNGAIIHYAPDEQSNKILESRSFFLLDTGGTYMGGTTDVTRTIAMGMLSEKEKEHYTAVLKGNLGIASARFKEGTTGIDLDSLARRPILEVGEDYNHGTGHGVGYMLNVHEGPNSIRNKVSERAVNNIAFAEGMITSNEPGIYREGEYGIRLETLVLCRKAEEDLLEFETLTLVPFDLDAVIPEKLTTEEKLFLNSYHKEVYKKIAPLLTEDEALWLKKATREI